MLFLLSCVPQAVSAFSLRTSLLAANPVRHILQAAGVLSLLTASVFAQTGSSRQEAMPAGLQALAQQHPQWANAANDAGALPADQPLKNLMVVVARTPQQESAFTQFLEDQQNPSSPNYHHWLTPTQIADRFGPSADQSSAISDWLTSQGLHVDWVAPSRGFLGFSGSAASVGQAFHTQIHSYTAHGRTRIAPATDPLIPSTIAPAVKAVRGLFTIEEKPQHMAQVQQAASPEVTFNGSHFLAPVDFNTIYDISGNGGNGETIGIVGRSRTDMADFQNFQSRTSWSFPLPTEVIPTAFGGIDPGPAYTSPPAGNVDLGDQLEATLDVLRAGSVAPASNLLLVVATGASGGIGVDTQYLVQTTPAPASVINISFGACESQAGLSGVNYWDSLFQQAAAEGISVFVSSGDSGASGCDQDFTTPPASPLANSPNYICSSSYATCVGGTEFNDTSNPGAYWNSTNSPALGSAINYIPEGAWNEPLNSKSKPQIAASGGGVSSFVATPSWQTGTGVPSGRAGRYTPDLAFSASGHDEYFACFAAAGASCVPDSEGRFEFEYMYGTSAAAPSMAGITALLNQKLGVWQGNLNPQLYPLAARTTDVFHDTTVSSSGVSSCQVSVPSMCNNSAPGTTSLSGGQPGYTINTGYDEVTGLGSLDVANFLTEYTPALSTPSITATPSSPSVTTAQDLSLGVQVSGATTIQATGTVTVTSGTYSSGPQALAGGFVYLTIPAATLPAGTDTLTVAYTPDAASTPVYSATSTTLKETVTAVAKITPTITITPANASVTTTQPLQLTLYVNTPAGDHLPTGTVQLSSGSYTSTPAKLDGSSNVVYITVPVLVLPIGSDTIRATYTPDAGSAPIYTAGTGTVAVNVTQGSAVAPLVNIAAPSQSFTTADSIPLTVNVGSGPYYPVATGTVTLTAGPYSAGPVTLSNGSAAFTIPANTLSAGTVTIASNYTPDATSSAIFTNGYGSLLLSIATPPPPAVTLTATSVKLAAGATTGNTSTITVTPANGFTGNVTLTASVTSSPTGAIHPPTLSFGSTGTVGITGTAAGTATLTISTTAASSPGCTNTNGSSQREQTSWYPTAGSVLALVVFFCIPARRRAWRGLTGLVLLLAACSVGLTACGGGGGGGTSCSNAIAAGTTTGSYTISAWANSGSITNNTTLTLTVQ